MAIVSVQHTSGTSGTFVNSFTRTYGSTVTAANFLLAVIAYEGPTTSTVADSNGNSFTLAIRKASGFGSGVEIWYCENCLGGASNVVTATGSGQFVVIGMAIAEFSGVATSSSLDQTANNVPGSTTAPSSGNVTTSNAGELYVGAVMCDATANTFTEEATWTGLYNTPNMDGDIGGAAEFLIGGAGGTYAATWSLSGATTCRAAAIATFLNAGGGGGSITNVTDAAGTTITHVPTNHGAGTVVVKVVGSGTNFQSGDTWTVSNSGGSWSFNAKTVNSTTNVTITSNCPAAASPPVGATGTLTITNTTLSLSTTLTVSTPTLAISPTSGNTSTTPSLTATGANTLWANETAAGLLSESGGTGASIGTPTVTNNTAISAVTLTTGSASGTLTITDTSTGATATFTVSPPPVTILVNDTNWFFSPYNWYVNGSTSALSNNPGAYFKINFTGTSCLMNVDVSVLVANSELALRYPAIIWTVDSGAFTRYQLQSTDTQLTLATGLSAGTHTLLLYFVGAWYLGDRWNTPVEALIVDSLVLDGGAASAAPTKFSDYMIVYGDSQTEAQEVLASGVVVGDQDASLSHGQLEALALQCEVGIVAFASQGVDGGAGGGANVPALTSSWDFYFSGQSRLSGGLFTPAPKYILSVMGQNDGGNIQASYTSLIAAWRAAAPSAKIILGSTANQTHAAQMQAAVVASGDANAFWAPINDDELVGAYINGGHLSGYRGQPRYASMILAGILNAIGGGTGSGPANAGIRSGGRM